MSKSIKDTFFKFEELNVYQKSLDYVDLIYQITAGFPKPELYNLADQFRRASISICLNIAEGSGGSKIEFSRFLRISRRSVRECVAVAEIAFRQKLIDSEKRIQIRSSCEELSRMWNGLMRSLIARSEE
jgi:four helix bundle protein